MARTLLFQPSQFVLTAHDTAKDKADFANHFVRFVSSDFKWTLFTKRFYNRLSMCFGHIAHFDRAGFYGTFFKTLEGKIEFLCQAAEWPCLGSPEFTYSDVERVLGTWVRQQGFVEKYRALLGTDVEQSERALLRQLKAKYPDE